MKLSDYIADFLVREGVKHLFLLPGGACMHLCDSVGKRPELDYVCCLHEQACAFAAEAYGEYTNNLGVCLVTAGPGSTNALTGTACAWIESSPVLFISGQAKRADLIGDRGVRSMGPQEVDIISMAKPVTKYAVRLMDPTRVRYELEKAVYTARQGRKGPVWIDIPLDVQATNIDAASLEGFVPHLAAVPDLSRSIHNCIEALKRAQRPVIYAGNGVRTSGQTSMLQVLVEKLGIPVLLSWKAADLFHDEHPCYIGRPGGIGQRAANFAQQKADLIFVLGARLDLPSLAFDHANFAKNAVKIFIDIDSRELAKFQMKLDLSLCADLADVLPALVKALEGVAVPDYSPWRAVCRSWVKQFPVVAKEQMNLPGNISTYHLIDVLSDFANSEDVIVPGSSGPCSDILFQAWRVKSGQRILNAPGLGAMGTGLPASIGACLASGLRRVINVNGDGGFLLNIQDLETVGRLGLPIKYFVLDNQGYRSIVAMQRNHFEGRLVGSDASSGLTLPNVSTVAESFGIPSIYFESLGRLREKLTEIFSAAGPMVCVIRTSVDESTAPRCTSEIRPDGTIVTKPMEDMWPFLDRAVFDTVVKQ